MLIQAGKRSTVIRFKQDTGVDLDASTSEASSDTPARAAAVKAVDPSPQLSDALYNWREQWYPVHYTVDLVEGQPQRVWLFDEAIVVARRPGNSGACNMTGTPHVKRSLTG